MASAPVPSGDRSGVTLAEARVNAARSRVQGRNRQTLSHVLELRHALGLSQVGLAAAASTTIQTVRKAERGFLLQLRVDTILRLATALEVGAADLFPIFERRADTL